MPDLRISNLPGLGAAALASTDPIPVADLSASETKKVTIKDLLQGGIALIDDGSIPGSKVSISIPPGSVGTTELTDQSVTAIKIADNSVVLVQSTTPAAGAFVGQVLLDTSVDKTYCWNGSSWVPIKAAGSVNSIVSGYDDVLELTIVITGDQATIVPAFKAAVGANLFAAGPNGSAGAISLRSIASTDLPPATNNAIGAISTPVGGGLRTEDPSGVGQNANAVIDNDIAASLGVNHLVTYSDKGLVLSGREIAGTDLPNATAGTSGVIKAGTEFTVDPTGILKHANQVSGGTFTKITYDAQGHVKSGANLDEQDIPKLDASIINSGTFAPGLVADRSITQSKLGNYSISYIQEQVPLAQGGDHHIGMLWFQESSGTLSMWNGNSWMAAADGALYSRNLRYAGTFDPNTENVTGTTSYGAAEGGVIGNPVPTPSDDNAGLYWVADRDALAQMSPPLDGVTTSTLTAGDWILSHGAAPGYVFVDMTGGTGGGGAGAANLGDLLDVTLTSVQPGQFLSKGSSGQWINVPAPVSISQTQPVTPQVGQTWTDTSTNPPTLKVWDGSNWIAVGVVPSYANELIEGIVQFADDAIVKAGTNLPGGNALAVSALHLKANYYQNDNYIQNLPDLP